MQGPGCSGKPQGVVPDPQTPTDPYSRGRGGASDQKAGPAPPQRSYKPPTDSHGFQPQRPFPSGHSFKKKRKRSHGNEYSKNILLNPMHAECHHFPTWLQPHVQGSQPRWLVPPAPGTITDRGLGAGLGSLVRKPLPPTLTMTPLSTPVPLGLSPRVPASVRPALAGPGRPGLPIPPSWLISPPRHGAICSVSVRSGQDQSLFVRDGKHRVDLELGPRDQGTGGRPSREPIPR